MKKYWYFTAIIAVEPQGTSISQSYYVSATAENENEEGKFTLGVAEVSIIELCKKSGLVKSLLDLTSQHILCVIEVSKYDFEHTKGSVTIK